MANTKQPCTAHPKSQAGWHCPSCDRYLCAACVAEKPLPTSTVEICVHCRELVEPLRVLRAEARPFASRIGSAFNFPLSKAGVFTMVVLGIAMYVADALFGPGLLRMRFTGFIYALALGLVWAYIFSIARKSAFGSDEIETPDFSDVESDLFMPARRGVFALFVMTLPAILYAVFNLAPTHESRVMRELPDGTRVEVGAADPERMPDVAFTVDENGELVPVAGEEGEPEGRIVVEPEGPPRFLASPIFWVLLVLGALFTPMALVIAIAGGSYLDIVNPVRHVAAIAQVPGDYAILTGGLLLLLVQYGIDQVGEVLSTSLPILPGLASTIIGMYVPLVLGRMLGLFIYVHGARLGYLPESDLYEGVVSARPGGAVPDVAAAPAPHAGAPGAAEPSPPAGRGGVFEEGAAAVAGVAGAAAAWAPPPRQVEGLDLAPDEAPAYTRPRTITLDDEPVGDLPVTSWGNQPEPLDPAAPAHAVGDARREVDLAGGDEHMPTGPSAPERPATFGDPAAYDTRAFDFLDEPGPSPELAPADPLLAAIAAGQYAKALEHYRTAGPELLQQVGGDALFEIGRQAATEADYPIAVKALKAAAQADPRAPVAPKSLVVLGRVLEERMGDAANAAKVFQHIVRAYPGTEAAKFAAARLPPGRP